MEYEFFSYTDIFTKKTLDRVKTGENQYFAGDQVRLFEDLLGKNLIFSYQDDDYQGSYFIVFKKGKKYCIHDGYFGSCGGCDSLEGSCPIEWLENYGKDFRVFKNKEDLKNYLLTTEDYRYNNLCCKEEIINLLSEK